MAAARFVAGDRVSVHADRQNTHLRPGVYTVTRALPTGGGVQQYRVKNDLDAHERVLDEAVLHPV